MAAITTAKTASQEAEQIKRTGKTAQQTQAEVYTDTTTNTAQARSGSLKNTFNKEAVQNELDLQRDVTQEFGKLRLISLLLHQTNLVKYQNTKP